MAPGCMAFQGFKTTPRREGHGENGNDHRSSRRLGGGAICQRRGDRGGAARRRDIERPGRVGRRAQDGHTVPRPQFASPYHPQSPAERKMVMRSGGHSWRDHAMDGGAGSSAVAQPKSRVIPGNPPATARAKGPAIQEWAMLANLPDGCDKLSGKDFAETARAAVCCPAWPMAWPRRAASRIVASQSWNDDMVSIADTMKKVARAAETESTTTRR